MQQQQARKKIIVMTSVSLGIIFFAFLLPIVIIPLIININKANNCIDYNCANQVFTECGVYESSVGSGWADTWTIGMRGMMCMMGFDGGAKATAAFAGIEKNITLNKAWLYIG